MDPAVRPSPLRYIPDLAPPEYSGPAPATDAEIEAHIIETVRALQRDHDDLVNLANVRDMVHPQLGRAAMDAALARISRIPGITLVPEEDQHRISQPERDSALRLGMQDVHYIATDPDRR